MRPFFFDAQVSDLDETKWEQSDRTYHTRQAYTLDGKTRVQAFIVEVSEGQNE